MKLFESLYTNEDIINRIEKDCSKFLKESKGYRLFRGTKSHNTEFYIGEIRQNRQPVNTSLGIDFFNGFNDGMKLSHFKAIRSNSILTTGNSNFARAYGNIYIILPVKDYDFTYSTEVSDYVFEYIMKYQDSSDRIKRKQSYEDGLSFWSIVKSSYTNRNLVIGIKSKHEVLITGKIYYAILYNSDLKKEVTKYFNLN